MKGTILQKIAAIAKDRKSGAADLAKRAASLIEEYASLKKEITPEELHSIAETLARAQPDMAPIVSLARRIAEAGKPEEVVRIAKEYQATIDLAKEKIPAVLASIIHDDDKILTHSASSTVRNAVISLHQSGLFFELAVTESAPGYEGRELAEDLKREHIPCTLIPDSEVLHKLREYSMAIVGADWVGEDFFINKTGTLALAKEAKRLEKGFYVLCDTTKFVKGPYSPTSPLFEKIPLDLVTGIITEKGMRELL